MSLTQAAARVTGVISIRGGTNGQYGFTPQNFSGTISTDGKLAFAIGPSWRMNFSATVSGDSLTGIYFATGTGTFGTDGAWAGTRP